MPVIDKASILSQLATLVSSLGMSNEETETLLLYLKTALNGSVDTGDILSELTSRFESLSISDSTKEIVLLVTAITLTDFDRVLTVADISDLDNLISTFAGTIVFVESINVPYIKKSSGEWSLIDPALQPAGIIKNAWAWGNNLSGQLGDNTTTSRLSPVSVVGGFSDWVQVSAGSDHSLGVRTNGTAWSWGLNDSGQLGDNTTTSRLSPVSVVGDFTDWIQVSAGDFHSLGVRANGTIWSWGNNTNGRLGDNTSTFRLSPVSIVGGFTDWIQVSAGGGHSLGLRANGTAWAWGVNFNGRLGDNTTTSRSSPVSVVGGFTDWVQVSAGLTHSLGLRANGTAWAWGANGNGRLGDGTTTDRSSPVSIVGGFTDWIDVSAGGGHSIGVRANGTAWAWGVNSSRQLGDNTATSRLSPVSVVGGFMDWVQVSAGNLHSLGVRANGSAWAWGLNTDGQLGDNTTAVRSSPVSVVGGFADWIQVSAGREHSLGVRG
jgi:alpha-tubulin suppressor-like RCC1 family protein